MIKNNKYKDYSPNYSIKKMLSILEQLELECDESWLESIPNMYSLQVKIKNTNLFANGKGTSKLYAKASAYAELLERLQNFLPFKLSNSFISNYLSDIKMLSSDCGLSKFEKELKWSKMVFKDNNQAINEMLHRYNDTLNCACFIDSKSGDKIKIPNVCIDYFYGSNGMSAGNTYEEATVQALSEIFERHVIGQLIVEQSISIFPLMNDLLSSLNKEIKDNIELFEKNGIIAKILDVSRNKYPVIATVFIDTNTSSYFVNGASHPDIFIATERTFTEFLQGRTINELDDLSSLGSHATNVSFDKNRGSIFHNGVGEHPISFFNFTSNAEELNTIWKHELKTNIELLEHLTSLISENYSVYVRKCGFLGLPSVHIIVPNFSEVASTTNLGEFNRVLEKNYLSVHFDELIKSKAGVNRIIKFLSEGCISEDETMRQIFNLSRTLEECDIYDNINKSLLLTMLHQICGNLEQAMHSLAYYINFLENEDVEMYILEYYRSYNFILNLLNSHQSTDEVKLILESCDWSHEKIQTMFNDFNQVDSSIPRLGEITQSNLSESERNDLIVLRKLLKKSSEWLCNSDVCSLVV